MRKKGEESDVNEEYAAEGIGYLHSYEGPRPLKDFNACGQAAVAAVLDFHGLDPYGLEKPVYDEEDGGHHWRDEEIVDRIKGRFPPDHLFGLLGTTGGRIAEALADAGLQTRAAHSKDPEVGRGIWEEAKRWANAGLPVVVIVDRGKLGGRPLAAHWAVVHKVAGQKVHLANAKGAPVVPEERFLRAFRCQFMPAGFNHCAIFSRPG